MTDDQTQTQEPDLTGERSREAEAAELPGVLERDAPPEFSGDTTPDEIAASDGDDDVVEDRDDTTPMEAI